MHKHKLILAENGYALMCVLPDCRTGGKPFVVAGGDMVDIEEFFGILNKEPNFGSPNPEVVQELPRCPSCRTRTIVNIGGFIQNAFCGGCGKQLLKGGKPIS